MRGRKTFPKKTQKRDKEIQTNLKRQVVNMCNSKISNRIQSFVYKQQTTDYLQNKLFLKTLLNQEEKQNYPN